MSEVRIWQRRHTTGVLAVVTPVPGMGTWEVTVSRSYRSGHEHLGTYFSMLTDAHAAADGRAMAISAHDCSLCKQWAPNTRRTNRRGIADDDFA